MQILISTSLFLIGLFSCAGPDINKLSPEDIAAIEGVRLKYNQGWLEQDSAKILSTLTFDAVLIPHHGDQPVEGLAAIKQFWWPPNLPITQVTRFSSDIEEIGGSPDLAFIRGRFELVFTYDSLTFSNRGNFLNLLRKEPEGWKLARLMWNDPLPETL